MNPIRSFFVQVVLAALAAAWLQPAQVSATGEPISIPASFIKSIEPVAALR